MSGKNLTTFLVLKADSRKSHEKRAKNRPKNKPKLPKQKTKNEQKTDQKMPKTTRIAKKKPTLTKKAKIFSWHSGDGNVQNGSFP